MTDNTKNTKRTVPVVLTEDTKRTVPVVLKRIGITGGMGAGKSEVTRYLRGKGYTVIDADEAAREAAVPGEPAMLRLREEIGDGIFLEDGNLDRQALAKLMFYDSIILMTVNEIFHRDIWERIEKHAKECEERGEQVVFLAVPLLFESDMDWGLDETWLVTADDSVRIERAMKRDGISEEDAIARMQSQMPEEEKRARAGVIIENNGTKEELLARVDGLLAQRPGPR